MVLRDTFHVTYCTNIHPGQDWETTFDSLRQHLPVIRKKMDTPDPFGVGLRLSNQASLELGKSNRLNSFKEWLDDNSFYVFTMNGFPYGPFHGTTVKDRVHAPDWTYKERHTYTERLFEQLSVLLPPGMEGGISTSPVSYKHWYSSPEEKKEALNEAAVQMAEIALKLYRVEEFSGSYLHLDIEPEPDGLIENTREVISYFRDYLIPRGTRLLSHKHGIPAMQAEELLRRHINVCYDICHFALVFEHPKEVFGAFAREGIRIGKIQVSAALKADLGTAALPEVLEALEPFDEPVYLHQVRLRKGDKITAFNDIGDYLSSQMSFDELRSHYHVPIFTSQFGSLKSTQGEVLEVLEYLKHTPVCKHLEVETYTWDVLPEALKQEIDTSICRELMWLKEVLLS